MAAVSGFDHIALSVPDLDRQVERFATMLGMVVESRSDQFALVSDPASGFKIELSRSPDAETHLRHLGSRCEDVDTGYSDLVEAGMMPAEAPHRRDFARMYTAFLREENGLEVQLAKYE